MNKDLDDRLIPNGEYRDAQNLQISRSEGSSVGEFENIPGNSEVGNLLTGAGVAILVRIVLDIIRHEYVYAEINISRDN